MVNVAMIPLREAAERLGVHENTVRNWIDRAARGDHGERIPAPVRLHHGCLHGIQGGGVGAAPFEAAAEVLPPQIDELSRVGRRARGVEIHRSNRTGLEREGDQIVVSRHVWTMPPPTGRQPVADRRAPRRQWRIKGKVGRGSGRSTPNRTVIGSADGEDCSYESFDRAR